MIVSVEVSRGPSGFNLVLTLPSVELDKVVAVCLGEGFLGDEAIFALIERSTKAAKRWPMTVAMSLQLRPLGPLSSGGSQGGVPPGVSL